jgi:predicted DNA-binding protein
MTAPIPPLKRIQKGILPRLRLSSDDEHEWRLFALAERLDRQRDALLKEAIEDLLSRYESKIFGGLMATQKSGDEERPLVDFLRLTCHECQSNVLDPGQHSGI